MAKELRVYFEGLCGFVTRNGVVEVYLFSGPAHHQMHRHGQQLLIPTDFIEVKDDDSIWEPTSVALILDGSTGKPRQVGIWSLAETEATFADGYGEPSWLNKERVIALADPHPGSSTSEKRDILRIDRNVGIVTLRGRTTELEPQLPGSNDKFSLRRQDNTTIREGEFSRIVEWRTSSSNAPSITRVDGKRILLRQDLDAWWGSVSNVAPVPEDHGLVHFAEYYRALPVDEGERLKLYRIRKPEEPEAMFADVYDCVPPIVFP